MSARALVADLVKSGELEVRRGEIVGRDLATYVDQLARPPSVDELTTFLEEHAQVTGMFASANMLGAALDRHLPPPAPPIALARHPELERAIRETHDVSAYQVYADWLQEQGDPLGEQIALGLGDDDARFARYVRTNAERIFGQDAREVAPLGIGFRGGLIDTLADYAGTGLDYRPVQPEVWAKLLRTRSCEFLRALRLGRAPNDNLLDALHAHASPSLRVIDLHMRHDDPPALVSRPLHRLALVGVGMRVAADTLSPELEHLQLNFSHVQHKHDGERIVWNVRTLQLNANANVAAFLRRIELPRIESLTAHGGDPSVLEGLPGYRS